MESRLDRYKKRRKRTFLRLFKTIIFICLISALSIFMLRVNKTIEELNVIENTKLFDVDLNEKSISILGKTYYITVK